MNMAAGRSAVAPDMQMLVSYGCHPEWSLLPGGLEAPGGTCLSKQEGGLTTSLNGEVFA